MAKKEPKEILMYVGGEPKRDDGVDKRTDVQKKWDKIVSGEATIKELGETFTEGNANALRTCDVGDAVGFSGNLNRMRVLTVHVGYSREEMMSEAFQDYMKRTKAEVENIYGKKNIEMGFHIPAEETPQIGSYGFGHIILSDPEECAILKMRLQKKVGAIDIVDVRINPEIVKRERFGLGGSNCTTPGPVKDPKGEYHLPYKDIVEHEIMHCISGNTRAYDPTFFGDAYFRSLYESEARSILGGNHQEFIPADKDGKPIEGGCDTMKKVLSLATPKDENVFMVDKEGTKHKLLVINPGANIMRGPFTNKSRAEAIKKGTYISPSQKAAIREVIITYLAYKNRYTADKVLDAPEIIIKDAAAVNKKSINTAKLGRGQRT